MFAFSASTSFGQDLEADRLHAWEFQRNDLNPTDQWPKGWKRRQDREHPAYVNMKVVPRDPEIATAAAKAQTTLSQWWTKWETGRLTANYNPERLPEPVLKNLDRIVNRCFEIQMDGGSAEVVSPIVKLDQRYSYCLDASLICNGLDGHRAWLELELLDSSLKTVGIATTESFTGTTKWKRVECQIPSNVESDFQAARVHIIVQRNESRQFKGTVQFDNIWINRVPRLELRSNLKLHTAHAGQPIEINCSTIGISNLSDNSTVRFQLLNELGEIVKQESVSLSGDSEASHFVTTKTNAGNAGRLKANDNGKAVWQFKIDRPGHYTVRVYLGKLSSRILERQLKLVVVDQEALEKQGPFGWSLPSDLSTEQLRNLPQLVRTYGASTIKIPVWLDVIKDAETIDQIAWLIERLQAQKVNCIGVIDQPPASQRKHFNDSGERLPIVTIFQNKATWEPLLDPILSRMTMKLNWFQLGSDDDRSFVGNEKLISTLSEVHSSVQTYSQELHLAIAWSWLDGLPHDQALPWEATQLSIEPELRAEELAGYVNGPTHQGTIKWLSMNFLPADSYSLLDRARDLTDRMTMMKRLGVASVYVTKPLDPNVGLFNAAFEPQALAVPWRTLVQHIGSAAYVGSNLLPSASQNHVFQNGTQAIMVLWNDSEMTEQLFLGDEVDAVDLWGRPVLVQNVRSSRGDPEQSIQVGPWPIIVRGIDLTVSKFRMEFELGTASLQSLTGRGQVVPIKIGNPFGKVVRVNIDLVAPSLLEKDRASLAVQLNPDRTIDKDFPLQLRNDVSAGKHAVRFDFQIEAERTKRFSTYHELTVGFDDVDLQWQLLKVSDTLLMLRLTASNRSNLETAFNCKFFPPPFPYQHLRIDKLLPGTGNREFLIHLPSVDESAEYWIRCEEIGSRRTLNYRIRVEQDKGNRTRSKAVSTQSAKGSQP